MELSQGTLWVRELGVASAMESVGLAQSRFQPLQARPARQTSCFLASSRRIDLRKTVNAQGAENACVMPEQLTRRELYMLH